MSKTKATSLSGEKLKRATELMRVYVQSYKNKEELKASIANAMKSYDDNMKQAQAELLLIGKEHKAEFNKKGNLELGDGYLHIAENTVVVRSKKFDAQLFANVFPELIDLDKAMKVSPIKKAFLNGEQRKELKNLGVDLTTSDTIEVCVHKGD